MSTPKIETDRLVRSFINIRNARKALKDKYDTEDEALESKLKTIEIELLDRALKENVTGFTCKGGTTYIAEEVSVSIADADAFHSFVRETGDLDFYVQRASLGHIREYQKIHEGKPPPGIKLFRENRMRVRAAKKKGAQE